MFEKHDTQFKIILYGLLMLVLYMLQSVPAMGVRFMGNSPELLLILTVGVSFFESEVFSAFFGLTAGVLSDIVTNGIIGKSAIFFMFAAFFISVLLQTLLRRIFLTYILLILGACALYLIGEYLFTAVFLDRPPFVGALTGVMLPKFFFTGVLAYPLYAVVNKCHKITTRRDED